jgi:hypothetical protein
MKANDNFLDIYLSIISEDAGIDVGNIEIKSIKNVTYPKNKLFNTDDKGDTNPKNTDPKNTESSKDTESSENTKSDVKGYDNPDEGDDDNTEPKGYDNPDEGDDDNTDPKGYDNPDEGDDENQTPKRDLNEIKSDIQNSENISSLKSNLNDLFSVVLDSPMYGK